MDAAYLSDITGYPGVALDACVIEICGGVRLELLDYRVNNKTLNDMATANPGNVHICLEVEDIKTAWLHAIECGAESVSPGPVSLTSGPNAGASAGYLKVHDGLTVELVEAKA